MPQPLSGLRVADFSHVIAGPLATHFLRLLGAEVIKVETAVGDLMRYYGEGADHAGRGLGVPFVGANCGKKSVVLDLKHPTGLKAARKLIASADIVVENFRPGVMQRLGLGFGDCERLNPKLIYCSVSGYGQHGPMRDYPAIDNVVQATSGMMDVSGEEGAEPLRFGVPAVDTYAATLAAMAVVAAVAGRERFGHGQYIDVAMMDASLVLLFGAAVPYLVAGREPEKLGNVGFSGQPTAASFRSQDGRVVSLGIVQQYQFKRFAQIVGKDEWLSDPRFATHEARLANGPAMRSKLVALFATAPAEHWETLLSQNGIPCGLVRTVPEALDLEHVRSRGLRMKVPAQGLPCGTFEVLNAGFRFARDGPGHSEPPPLLGAHTEEVLRSLELTDEDLEQLTNTSRELRQAGGATST